MLRLFLSGILVVLAASCARMAAPPGGPADETPPTIIDISPKPGTCNVVRQPEIEITFSEKLSTKSILPAIKATPPLGKLTLETMGTTYILQPKSPLREDQTYVVTLSGYRDRHNVRQDSVFTFAFSTGDILDNGRISGKLLGEERYINAATIRLFDVADSTEEPLYQTKSTRDGTFELNYLRLGQYHVEIFKDLNRNDVFDRGVDAGTELDLHLTADQPVVSGIPLKLAITDTAHPYIRTIRAEHHRMITVEFSEQLQADSLLSLHAFTLTDTLGVQLPLLDMYLLHNRAESPPKRTQLRFLTAPQQDTTYAFFADTTLTDLAGNTLYLPAGGFRFQGTTLPDTLPPTVVRVFPPPHATPAAIDITVEVAFDEWVDSSRVEAAFSLKETARNTPIPGKFHWETPLILRFQPEEYLQWVVQYTATLDSTACDLSGNPLKTPLEWKFLPVPARKP